MKKETLLVQVGMRQDRETGAISTPIHHSTTFAHGAAVTTTNDQTTNGEAVMFAYSRSANPTRKVLEDALAELESGCQGFAFASGMAAIHAVLTLFNPGDHLIVSDDLYGGTYRLLEQVFCRYGISVSYVDTSNTLAVEHAILEATRAIFIESPTNPTLKITDIAACASLAERFGEKYLGGHNDVLAGAVIVRDEVLGEKIAFIQNSIGAVLGPDDCWLLLRGIKTLALRMERHQSNALAVATWLSKQDGVTKVYYPGLEAHPGHRVQARQSSGYGGMLSFEVADAAMVHPLLSAVRVVPLRKVSAA